MLKFEKCSCQTFLKIRKGVLIFGESYPWSVKRLCKLNVQVSMTIHNKFLYCPCLYHSEILQDHFVLEIRANGYRKMEIVLLMVLQTTKIVKSMPTNMAYWQYMLALNVDFVNVTLCSKIKNVSQLHNLSNCWQWRKLKWKSSSICNKQLSHKCTVWVFVKLDIFKMWICACSI